ncbi:MAG: hypothetical protein IT233_08185 [Bacteroidia bacterium]|nr:hypothetical protein [Bacteroidia bacterium]
MKRKESKEPDVYVVNRKPTEKELKQLVTFVKEHKQKRKAKKHRRAA